MKHRAFNLLSHRFAVAALALSSVFGVQAQMAGSTGLTSGNSSSGNDPFSSMAATFYAPGSRYIGLSAGQSNYSLGDGVSTFFNNDRRDNAYSLTTGSFTSANMGAEIGYTDFGRVNRAGGTSKAQGFNVSAIGRLPLGSMFNVLGKLGTTYSYTDVSSAFNAGVATGRGRGFGLSYGLGGEVVFTPEISAVVQYDRHNLRFAGGRDWVGASTVGLRYRF